MKYRRDILIFADDAVKKRKGGLLEFGGHEINRQELGELGQGQVEVGVVNTGREDAAIWLPKSKFG